MLYFEQLDSGQRRKIPFKKAVIRLPSGEPIAVILEFADNHILVHHKAEPEFESVIRSIGLGGDLQTVLIQLPEIDKDIHKKVQTPNQIFST